MFEHLSNKALLDNEKIQEFVRRFKRIEVAAKNTLLREGDIANKLFWVEQGCMRIWFNNDGKDITFQFFFENSLVASMESFRKNIPSIISLETIEPCVLWYAEKKDVQNILEEIIHIVPLEKVLMDVVFERTFDYMKHCLSYIKDTPQQRYLNLIKENPQLIQRVPQHFIASYLGISKVHLSRIRNKLSKEKEG